MDAPANICSMSVLIPDAETMEALKVLRCLGQTPKMKTFILSRDRWIMARFSRHCAGYYQNTSQTDDDWLNEIIKLVKELNIDIVLPVTVDGVELVSRNRQTISEFAAIPPLAKPELIEMANNKWAFHEFVKEHGLPGMPTVLLGNAGEAIDDSSTLDSVEYPALLKPTSQRGGFGIVKLEDSSQFNGVWNNERIMKGQQYILQSYIQADDYSLSVCCKQGEILAYTLYRVILPSENPYRIGRLVEYVNEESVLDVGRQLVSAMEWDGVADIDLLFNERDHSVMILEFNPRFWQSLLGGMIAGVNFPLIWCMSAMGISMPSSQREGTRYARPSLFVKMLTSKMRGKRFPVKIRWREGDLKYSVHDPLPELFNVAQKAVKRLRCESLN